MGPAANAILRNLRRGGGRTVHHARERWATPEEIRANFERQRSRHPESIQPLFRETFPKKAKRNDDEQQTD